MPGVGKWHVDKMERKFDVMQDFCWNEKRDIGPLSLGHGGMTPQDGKMVIH